LIALSACASGEVATQILNGDMAAAEEAVSWYKDTFGAKNYFLELQDHEQQWSQQKLINDGKKELSKKLGVDMVVTSDAHYCLPEDKETHEILLCVQTGKNIDDPTRMKMDMDLFLSSPEEISSRWSDFPDIIANTVKIANRCTVELELDQILIPSFEVPNGDTQRNYLHTLCWQGLMWRYGNIPKEDITTITEERARNELSKEVIERADFELGVISNMGYEGYFLIVADFINWGKNQGIMFGPGRGSAAGSIIAYAMNITELDPLKYDLLFERFLNPDRISMPDIDIDIQDSRREEVISYVIEKYGENRVAQIITFGTMAARNAVRDTGRVLGMSYGEVDTIAKLIPQPIQGRHIPLRKSIIDDPDLKKEYESNPRAKALIDQAMKLEGTIRSNGVHAAGVVIAPDEIVRYTPLQRAQKGGLSTQYSMGPIEDLGLLKMDFLGLSNLTIISNALRIIRKVYGVVIDITAIPLDDEKTFNLLTRGDTTGVFQFESSGMKRYLRELKPTVFEDVVAMGALYRPGPMQFIDEFIARKNGRSKITYVHPAMQNALQSTYGILVYQEQVMQIAKELSGFTGGQADTLRKAIGKKKIDVMEKMREEFIEGAIKKSGANRIEMEDFWKQLEDFAAYCFNKSHAACYGLISYQTAYLKAHFPSAFMAALLTSNYDNIDKIAIDVAECQHMGIEVLPPDVNESFAEFGVVPETNKIRFGLKAVKNIGNGPIEAILAGREDGGGYSSVEDFAKRVSASEVNKKVWESLIKCGAMDRFADRAKLLTNLDTLVGYAAKAQKNALSGQIDLFGSLGAEEELPALRLNEPDRQLSSPEKLGWEKELLGLYLSHHPLDEYAGWLADKSQAIGYINPDMEGSSVKVGGIITTVRKIVTKNNASMAFVGFEDKTGATELIVFPKAYENTPELWQPDQIVFVSGKVNYKDREGRVGTELKIMVDKAETIHYENAKAHQPKNPIREKPSYVPEELPRQITLHIKDASDPVMLMRMKDVLKRFPGDSEVYLVIDGPILKKIKLPFKVMPTPECLDKISEITGSKVFETAD
ncbi:MAG: DNA polymerase III subunit alpha, partial [Candidatus Saccharimonadia bacterium]